MTKTRTFQSKILIEIFPVHPDKHIISIRRKKKMNDDEVKKIVERAQRVNGPLAQLLVERYPFPSENDKRFQMALKSVEVIGQAVTDLITDGIL
jgi:hypothetical protein